jgi:hypothetical protein
MPDDSRPMAAGADRGLRAASGQLTLTVLKDLGAKLGAFPAVGCTGHGSLA